MGATVLVTGSSGYLASLVLPRLDADPGIERIVGIDVRPPAGSWPKVRHATGSVLDTGLADLFGRERPDVVLHMAWVFNPSHDREAMRRVDVDGTRNVLEAAAAARVRHVVYLSSTTSYGAHADNPARLREEDPPRGNEDFPYAADKAAVERILDAFEAERVDVGVTRLRPCIVLGRRTDNFVRAILDLPFLPRVLGHDPEMQFLHEDDLARCIETLVRDRPRGAYNLVPEDTVRVSEIARLRGRPSLALPEAILRGSLAALWALRLFGVPPSYLDFVKWPWVADGGKLRRATGFAPERGTREAVLATRPRP